MFNVAFTHKLLTLTEEERQHVISTVQVFNSNLYNRLIHNGVLNDEVEFDKDVHILLLHDGGIADTNTGSHFGVLIILGLAAGKIRAFFFDSMTGDSKSRTGFYCDHSVALEKLSAFLKARYAVQKTEAYTDADIDRLGEIQFVDIKVYMHIYL